MKNYIVYDEAGKILATGICPVRDFSLQTEDGQFVMEGTANDVTQKIEFDGFDVDGQPINPRVVDKTPEEIKAGKPAEIPFEIQQARITKGQWQEVLDRISVLESEV